MNRLYLIRHGENLANLTKELSHRKVDYPLTNKGILQAQQTATWLRDRGIDEMYCSPLKRASQTAEIIASTIKLPYQVIENFREVNVGALEGQPVTQKLWDAHNRIFSAWVEGQPEIAFPGGENHTQLVERLTSALGDILSGGDNRSIVIVGHGGIFFLSIPALCPGVHFSQIYQVENHNCSISEIEMQYNSGLFAGRLLVWANTNHLSGEAAQFVSGTPKPGELEEG